MREASAVLGLFAKAPVAGQVKTRLCPPLTTEQAASLYRAMLLDILEQSSVAPADRALWFTPEASRAWFLKNAPDFRLYLQQGPDLARRMHCAFLRHAEEGYGRILLRGTDSPTLPADIISRAFRALERADLVLCPDRDGGYNLVGLRRPEARLFELEMSTASVLERTLERAKRLSLGVELLPVHHDVDRPSDLVRLELDDRTPRTARWLADHRGSMKR